MKLSKKVLAVILSVIMVFSVLSVSFSVFAEDKVTPVVFLPGIGQSQTYMYDDEGNLIDDWHMFHLNTDFSNYSISDWLKTIRLVAGFIASIAVQRDVISQDSINDFFTVLFADHLRDKDGNFIRNVVTPNYPYPVSEYDKEPLSIFSRRIPCQGLIDEIGAENVYCYNYSIFSNTFDNADGLNDYIEKIVLPQTGADKVILVPMSMGATVVNAYMELYPDADRIDKVISVVGAWNGSDVFADMLLADFDENAPELVYTEAINEIGLESSYLGYIINMAVRILPKQEVDNILCGAIRAFAEVVISQNTSFMSLIPCERFPEFAEEYLGGDDMAEIRSQAESYAEAQSRNKERMYYQRDNYGTEFYFISGYNLFFGDCDYGFFRYFESYDETNSDEVIQISSTAPGTSFVKAGSCYDDAYRADPSHHVSPDGSLDTSTCYFEKTTWYFEGQKHELTYNNNALDLAYKIALNEIKSVDDCMDVYPQFNGSRDVRYVRSDYIPDAERIDRSILDAELAAELDANLAAAKAMVARTINNREEDDRITEALSNTLVKINSIYHLFPDKYLPEESDDNMQAVTAVLGIASKVLDLIFGHKGFSDFWTKLL